VLPESASAAAFENLPVARKRQSRRQGTQLGATTGPLWAVLTTSTSNGSVGAMHGSLNPLSLLGPFAGLWLNATFGGVGVGMINFFLFMILAVFVAGLMVGRTPEYLGKKVEAREMTLAAATFLIHPLLILCGSALFAATSMGSGHRSTIPAHADSRKSSMSSPPPPRTTAPASKASATTPTLGTSPPPSSCC
jgi:potassium-transporting ATPase potassium-binding subunit